MRLSDLIVLLGCASIASARTVSGMGCVCMAPTETGDQAIYDRTVRCCTQFQGKMLNTLNFWDRGYFYCHVPDTLTPGSWDQNCCRVVYGSGTYGFCNHAT